MALISLEGPSMFVLFVVLSAIFLQQDNAYFCTKDNGDFKQIQDILSKPRMLDRQKDEKTPFQKPRVEKFQWSLCGGATSPLVLKQLSIGPDPVQLPGNISVSFLASLSVPLKAAIELDLEVKKKIFVWVPIPCVDHVGSCHFDDVCDVIGKLPCPEAFKKYGIPCHCPAKSGTYKLPPSNVSMPVTHMPRWLTRGDYQITARLHQGGSELFCLTMIISVSN